jgi:chromosome segregation ATPase
VRTRLEELETQAEELRRRTGEMKETVSAELSEKLERLERQRKELRQDLEALESASADAWTDVQAGFEEALSDLEQAFEQAAGRFGRQGGDDAEPDTDSKEP